MESFQYKHIDSNNANSTVTVIANSPVLLHSIVVNKTSAHALTVKNAGGNASDTVAILKASIVEGTYLFDVVLDAGMTVEIPASYAGDATIAFKPL